jgi:hypothetical protein
MFLLSGNTGKIVFRKAHTEKSQLRDKSCELIELNWNLAYSLVQNTQSVSYPEYEKQQR